MDKGARLLGMALSYFYKHCPDPKAYYEDEGWSTADAEVASTEASQIIAGCR